MSIDTRKTDYVLAEHERLEGERLSITLRIAAWTQQCGDLEAFRQALTPAERSHVDSELVRRAAQDAPRLSLVQQQEGDDHADETTICTLRTV